jgi:hypothetical protein
MIDITANVVEGTGTSPREIDVDDKLLLSVSSSLGEGFEWIILSKPETSSAFFTAPNANLTRIVLDEIGVYHIQIVIDREAITQKSQTITLHVPGAASVVTAPQADFTPTGRVTNGTFQLAGVSAAFPFAWTVTDDANILNSVRAGVSRGRIIPTNFESNGLYVMCLGDEDTTLDSSSMAIGDTFEISQNVDFTDMPNLKLTIKFDIAE